MSIYTPPYLDTADTDDDIDHEYEIVEEVENDEDVENMLLQSQCTIHQGAIGAMTLRISELFLSFSPHPNISDGNFNLVHHFFRMQMFQIN